MIEHAVPDQLRRVVAFISLQKQAAVQTVGELSYGGRFNRKFFARAGDGRNRTADIPGTGTAAATAAARVVLQKVRLFIVKPLLERPLGNDIISYSN